MASDIAINLEYVCAIFEHCVKEDIATWSISDGQMVHTHDWGDQISIYGAPFADLLGIIAEEQVVIVPIDAGYMRQFPDANEAEEVRQNCRTVLCTRSMPHNRAHWIMRQILQNCHWPQYPRTEYNSRECFPTQAHIDAMIADHAEFVQWAFECGLSVNDDDDDADTYRKFKYVQQGLFPHAVGTIEASVRNIDQYFRTRHYDSYHLVQHLHLPRDNGMSLREAQMHEYAMCQQLPKLLKQNRIPVHENMHLILRDRDWWTVSCVRIFKKPATVRHQKRIHDEVRIDRQIHMSNFFLEHAAPFLCYKGIIHRDTVANIMKYCPVARPSLE